MADTSLNIIPAGSKKLEPMEHYINMLRKNSSLRVEKSDKAEYFYNKEGLRVGAIFTFNKKTYSVNICDKDNIMHDYTDFDGDGKTDRYQTLKLGDTSVFEYTNKE